MLEGLKEYAAWSPLHVQLQAGNHQVKLEEIVQNLANGNEELDSLKVQQVAQETAQL